MSDVMLHAVLNMPPELWSNTDLDNHQRYSRYRQASRRIEDDEKRIKQLEDEIIELKKALENSR